MSRKIYRTPFRHPAIAKCPPCSYKHLARAPVTPGGRPAEGNGAGKAPFDFIKLL